MNFAKIVNDQKFVKFFMNLAKLRDEKFVRYFDEIFFCKILFFILIIFRVTDTSVQMSS